MSRSHPAAPTHPPTPPYKTFIWDTGTTGKHASTSHLHTLAAIEYHPTTSTPRHTNLLIRPPTYPPHPDVPPFASAYASFLSFIRSATPAGATPLLVSHNAAFDAAILHAELARASLPPPAWRFACSLTLAREDLPRPNHPEPQPFAQTALAARFDVPVDREHHAGHDVIVLRSILTHLDKQPSATGRPLEARLWKQARPLTAWLPDDPRSDSDSSPADTFSSHSATRVSASPVVAAESSSSSHAPFITTRNGRYYHKDPHCYNLRAAKNLHRVSEPPPALVACPRCAPADKAARHAAPRASRGKAGDLSYGTSSASSSAPGTRPRPRAGKYITTNTGRLYHLDERCNSLRFAKQKHRVSAVPDGLSPCPRCVGDPNGAGGKHGAWRPVDKVVNGATGGAGGRPRVRTYVTTRTGKYFHGDEDCRYLRNANPKILVRKVPSSLSPCPKCIIKRDTADPAPVLQPSSADIKPVRTKRYGSAQPQTEMEASLKTYGSRFYKTVGGKKFHVDKSCSHLQGKELFKCDPLTESKDPCRTCALELFQEWEISGWTNRK